MYLKRLELQGFKSFADKTVLEFKPGITAVIGPNGSGKSNISDSIRWVLGEQSMKSLRGAKSEDIIFAGTQNRKSLGFAEASIVIDNTDGELPVEYAEVIVTRKIYRSGETGYFINKTPCRLKDILELFMDTGIGKDGYSIIGQGKIDEILSNKSEDRRHIFEEAAGIVKYRARKSESEKKLEQTKLNLLRINDILSEIETGLDPLRIQSEKAKRFLELHESLKDIEVGLFIHNIETYKEKLEQVVEDLKILENQKSDEEEKLNNIQNKKGTLKKQIDDLKKADPIDTKKIADLTTQISQLEVKITKNKDLLMGIKGLDFKDEDLKELLDNGIVVNKNGKIDLAVTLNNRRAQLNRQVKKYTKSITEHEKALETLGRSTSEQTSSEPSQHQSPTRITRTEPAQDSNSEQSHETENSSEPAQEGSEQEEKPKWYQFVKRFKIWNEKRKQKALPEAEQPELTPENNPQPKNNFKNALKYDIVKDLYKQADKQALKDARSKGKEEASFETPISQDQDGDER